MSGKDTIRPEDEAMLLAFIETLPRYTAQAVLVPEDALVALLAERQQLQQELERTRHSEQHHWRVAVENGERGQQAIDALREIAARYTHDGRGGSVSIGSMRDMADRARDALLKLGEKP